MGDDVAMQEAEIFLLNEKMGNVRYKSTLTMTELAEWLLPQLDWCECIKSRVARIELSQPSAHKLTISKMFKDNGNEVSHLYVHNHEDAKVYGEAALLPHDNKK